MTQKQLGELLREVFDSFSKETPRLELKLGKKDRRVHERAICFRLGLHLAKKVEPEFGFVDSEYNLDLNADDLKSLPGVGKTGRVMPDLIIHRRTKNKEQNITVIEVKFVGDDAGIQESQERIKKFREKYGYLAGAVVALPESYDNFVNSAQIIPSA